MSSGQLRARLLVASCLAEVKTVLDGTIDRVALKGCLEGALDDGAKVAVGLFVYPIRVPQGI